MEFLKEIITQIYDVKSLVMWAGYVGLVAIIFAETGLLIGFFLPGDSLLVTAGLFAATGELNIIFLNLLLIPAAILGNLSGYYIGKKAGAKLFNREQSFLFRKDYIVKTKSFYERHGASTMVITRFMPILRTFAPIVAGVGVMDYSKFLFYNVIGAVAWILSMTLIGFYLVKFIPGIDKHIEKVIVGVVIVSLLPGIIKYLNHKFRSR
ncbi:MAG: VTT domain-containing protein [Ignavibacteria bacterium]|nr:VTT domain-containing protein [Ignavibacteria bacterium]